MPLVLSYIAGCQTLNQSNGMHEQHPVPSVEQLSVNTIKTNSLSVINEENIKQLLDLLNTSVKDVKKPYLAPFSTEVYQFLKTRIADKLNTNTKSLKKAYDYLINSPDIKQHADLISKYFIFVSLVKGETELPKAILKKNPTLIGRKSSVSRFWFHPALFRYICENDLGDVVGWLLENIYTNPHDISLLRTTGEPMHYNRYHDKPFRAIAHAGSYGAKEVMKRLIYAKHHKSPFISDDLFEDKIRYRKERFGSIESNQLNAANLLMYMLLTKKQDTPICKKKEVLHEVLKLFLENLDGTGLFLDDSYTSSLVISCGFSKVVQYVLNDHAPEFNILFTVGNRSLQLPTSTKILDREQALNDLIEALESYNTGETFNRRGPIDYAYQELVDALNAAKNHNNTRLCKALNRLIAKKTDRK